MLFQGKDIFRIIDGVKDDFLLNNPEIEMQSIPIREAQLFANVLKKIPITIPDDCTCAGDFGIDTWNRNETISYTEKEKNTVLYERPEGASWVTIEDASGSFPGSGGHAHTTINYPRLIDEGMKGILAQIAAEKMESDQGKTEYLHAMEIALRAVIEWSNRYAAHALLMAETETDQKRKAELVQIATICKQVPEHPARTFAEGLQSIRFASLAIGISERSFASISFGRFDQYLYPLFKRDQDNGIPVQELESSLAEFFRCINRIFDPAMNLNIGGLDKNGEDCFNDLSALIIKVVKTLKLPAPILAVRIHEHTPNEQFEQYIDSDLFTMGQPTFYGEEPAHAALHNRGIPEEDLHNWGPNSCMGIMMLGQEWSDMWGSVVNAVLPLDLALNDGKTLKDNTPIGLSVKSISGYVSFDKIFDKVCEYQEAIVADLIEETRRRVRIRGKMAPNPFVSALIDNCINKGKDRLDGGCKYTTIIVEIIGLVNVADALGSLRELVFKTKKCTIEEMISAVNSNFTDRPDILKEIRAIPKFGNGDSEIDFLARKLAARFAAAVMKHSDNDFTFCPSFHTLAMHIGLGARTSATPDGRRAGEPLAKNIGTSPGRAMNGPTALIRSAATIDQSQFFGGQALDLFFDQVLFKDCSNRSKIRDLIRTYFRLGGLEIQVNTVSPQLLHEAQSAPLQHEDVLVRKAGFTLRFVSLGTAEQNDLIRRFEYGV